MSEKCVITIEDVLYQAKRKNRNIDIYKIKKAYLRSSYIFFQKYLTA